MSLFHLRHHKHTYNKDARYDNLTFEEFEKTFTKDSVESFHRLLPKIRVPDDRFQLISDGYIHTSQGVIKDINVKTKKVLHPKGLKKFTEWLDYVRRLQFNNSVDRELMNLNRPANDEAVQFDGLEN